MKKKKPSGDDENNREIEEIPQEFPEGVEKDIPVQIRKEFHKFSVINAKKENDFGMTTLNKFMTKKQMDKIVDNVCEDSNRDYKLKVLNKILVFATIGAFVFIVAFLKLDKTVVEDFIKIAVALAGAYGIGVAKGKAQKSNR